MHTFRTTAFILSSILVVSTQTARAEDPFFTSESGYPPAANTQGSTVTRAQVKAELAKARAAGLIGNSESDYPPAVNTQGSTVTRAQVKAELAKARAADRITTSESDV